MLLTEAPQQLPPSSIKSLVSHDFEIQSNLNKKHSVNEADQKVLQKSRNQPDQSLAIPKEHSLSLLLKENSQSSSENLKVSA